MTEPGGVPNDRRAAERATIELRVEYRGLNPFFADYTRNISKGGTFIRTDHPLPVGTEFVFALVIPGFDEPLRLLGKVKWNVVEAQANESRPAGMGIEFQYRTDGDRQAVDDRVEQAMIEQFGKDITDGLLGRR